MHFCCCNCAYLCDCLSGIVTPRHSFKQVLQGYNMGGQAYNLLSHPLPLPYTQAGRKCWSLHFLTQSLRPNGLNNKLTEQQTAEQTDGQSPRLKIIFNLTFASLRSSWEKKSEVGQLVRWVDCHTNALLTDQPTNQLTQPLIDKHRSLSLILFSRGHATLHLAMSVGRSVGRSVTIFF